MKTNIDYSKIQDHCLMIHFTEWDKYGKNGYKVREYTTGGLIIYK